MEKVYGPYTRKDGRKHVIVFPTGETKRNSPRYTVSYPKWLMENEIGKLKSDDTVDHINRIKTDDRLENFRVLGRAAHASEDALRAKLVEITCVWCGNVALKRPTNLRGNARQGKAGPFCGHSCAGKYRAELQNGRIKPLPAQPSVISEYYRIEKK